MFEEELGFHFHKIIMLYITFMKIYFYHTTIFSNAKFFLVDYVLESTARLVDGNEVMGIKCCNGNSNKGINMRISNEDIFVWCA